MCKFLGSLLGLEAPKVPEYKPPAPAAQAVNLDDGKSGEDMAEANRRKKRGFQSTRAGGGTILGSGGGKTTLG